MLSTIKLKKPTSRELYKIKTTKSLLAIFQVQSMKNLKGIKMAVELASINYSIIPLIKPDKMSA